MTENHVEVLDKVLSEMYPAANIPTEPFNGVQALFSGDLHVIEPSWAPRQDWLIISPYRIEHLLIDDEDKV